MKKKWVLATAGVMIMAMLTACGSKVSATQVELGNYKNLEITKIDTSVTEESLEKAIQDVIDKNTTYEQIKEGAIKDGDTANIDFVGKLDGEEFDGGSGTDYDLTIGSNSFIAGFEDGLIGVKVGEKVNLDLTFPENYSKDMAGKDVVFEVTVNYIRGEKIVPEFNEEFVKTISDFETVEEYKEDLKASLLKQNEENAKSNYGFEVIEKAFENAKVKNYSDKEVEARKEIVKGSLSQMTTMYGMTLDDFISNNYESEDAFEEELTDVAKDYVAQTAMLRQIAEKEKLVSEEEYDEKALAFVEQYGATSVEEFETTYGEGTVRDEIYREAATQFLLENAVEVEATPEPEATEAPTEEPTDSNK